MICLVPPNKEVDFGIDVLLDMQSICTPLCGMVPVKLKKLKEQLNDLLI